jgi:hypothetical protein
MRTPTPATPPSELKRLAKVHQELDRTFKQSDRGPDAMRAYVAARRPLRARMERLSAMSSK